MEKVTIYTMNHCPYCENAKRLLTQRGVAYSEIKVPEEDDAAWDALYEKSKMRTMPQIFANDQLIGGFSELSKLDAQDELKSLR